MKKAIIPTAILCTVMYLGLHTQPSQAEETIPTPEPPQVEVTATPEIETEIEAIIIESEIEESVIEVIMPEPMPTPAPPITDTPATQTVQAGDMVYVPGFGWLENQGEGTVTYNEGMRESGNKVGIMD